MNQREINLSRSCKGCKHNIIGFVISTVKVDYPPCYDCFRNKAYEDRYEKERD